MNKKKQMREIYEVLKKFPKDLLHESYGELLQDLYIKSRGRRLYYGDFRFVYTEGRLKLVEEHEKSWSYISELRANESLFVPPISFNK